MKNSLRDAHVPANAPILSYETYQDFSPVRDPLLDHGMPRAWLPLLSQPLLKGLSPERRQLYLQRFAERRPMAGWMLRHKESPLPTWLSTQLDKTHRSTRQQESPSWELTYWVPRS